MTSTRSCSRRIDPADHFYLFLMMNGCYSGFLRNFDPHAKSETVDRFFDLCRPEYYITTAFCWEDTPEGCGYWSNLDRKWKHYYRHIYR